MSRGSVLRASASISRMRALIGVRSSAPSVPGTASTRPGSPAGTTRTGAVVDGGADEIARRALIGQQHVDARQRGQGLRVELRLRAAALLRSPSIDHAIGVHDAEPSAVRLERVEPLRVGLGDVARAVDLFVHHDQRAAAA